MPRLRYLVTGVSGVVGKYIIKELLQYHNPEQIVGISRSFRYTYEDHPNKNNAIYLECYGDLRLNCIRLISQYQPSVVIHCAGIGTQNSPPKELWSANVDTTLNLLEACKYLNKVNFAYCSSIGAGLHPISYYNASKQAGELLVSSYDYMNNNISGKSVRFPAVAGAGNKHGVVKAIVDKLMDKSADTIKLLTNSKKPFVYAGELAEKLIYIANVSYYHGTYVLCPIDNITVRDIANIAMCKTNIKKNIEWCNTSWDGDQQEVKPLLSNYQIMDSQSAINVAIDDILREDYGKN